MRTSQVFVLSLEFAVVLVVICMNCHEAVCNRDHGPGWVEPSTVERMIGSDFNISCTKNTTFFQIWPQWECDIKDMYFVQANIGNDEPLKNVIIENETTIIYMVHNAERQVSEYRCMCGSQAFMDSTVYVGTKPQPVEDFNCLSYDFQYMFCNISLPNNTLRTKYNISYRSLDNFSYKYDINCEYPNLSTIACNITNEKYRPFDHKFRFQLDISNALDNLSQFFDINNYDRMVPSRPGDNLMILNKTADTICIQWQMKKRSHYTSKGLLWHVQVNPKGFPALFRDRWRNESSGINIKLCLDDLPYAGYVYELELRVRVNASNSVWSETYTNYNDLQTKEDRPRRPPRITSGSFYVYSSDTELRVYWEDLLQHEYNGKDFTYVISEYRRNNTLMNTTNIEVRGSSALIKNFQKNVRHEIFIRSHNRVNDSVEASRLEIMPIDDFEFRARTPINIRNVYQPNNDTFMLTWEAPIRASEVLNYTVYWCTTLTQNSECKGPIHFETVSSARRSYERKPETNQNVGMAVSANYKNYNTGMHYPKCILDVTSDLARMTPTVDSITNSSLTVKWDTGPVCDAILIAFNLTYCEVKIQDCRTLKIGRFSRTYTISGLKPYTEYNVKMLMYSKTKESTYSDELTNYTSEAAPSSPLLLNCTNQTSVSAVITWLRPNVTNGILRSYKITLKGNKKSERFELPVGELMLMPADVSLNAPLVYVLQNLSAFTTYTVSVQACTLYDSEPSNAIEFQTKVGEPTPPVLHEMKNQNGNKILEWSLPVKPAGPLEYYEVWISEQESNGKIYREYISYITSEHNRTCYFLPPKCISDNVFKYNVRAVNVEPMTPEMLERIENAPPGQNAAQQRKLLTSNSELQCLSYASISEQAMNQLKNYTNERMYLQHRSNWSTQTIQCAAMNTNYASTFMPIIAVLIASVFAVHILCKKYNDMSNIGVKLPSGLEPYYTKTRVEGISDSAILGGVVSSTGGGISSVASASTGSFGTGGHPPYISDQCGNEHSMPPFMRPQTRLDGNCGNESAKLLQPGSNTPDARCETSSYIDEPTMAELNDASKSSIVSTAASSPYTHMNSGSTVETLIDSSNNTTSTKPFGIAAGGGMLSEYTNANDFLNAAPIAAPCNSSDAAVGSAGPGGGGGSGAASAGAGGGYIKPANMLNLWHAASPAAMINAPGLAVGQTPTTADVMPVSGYITVQSGGEAALPTQSQSSHLTTEPSMLQKNSFAMTPVGSPNSHMAAADKLCTSGYVQTADLQKLMKATAAAAAAAAPLAPQTTTLTTTPFNSMQTVKSSNEMAHSKPPLANASGYTTMEQLAMTFGKASAGNTAAPFAGTQPPHQLAQQTEYTTPTRLQSQLQPQPISGYVTQRELNALAQQQQHHQHQLL